VISLSDPSAAATEIVALQSERAETTNELAGEEDDSEGEEKEEQEEQVKLSTSKRKSLRSKKPSQQKFSPKVLRNRSGPSQKKSSVKRAKK